MKGPQAWNGRRPREREVKLHISVAAFLRHAMPEDLPWWHTPNGEKRDKAAAGKLKAMGLLPGVPDLTFLLPNGQAAFIELKVADGQTTEGQEDFRNAVLALRCGYATCRSLDEVEATLNRWLGLYGRKLRATAGRRAA